MTFAALIATMVALATPTAHGTLEVRCQPIFGGGYGNATPWASYVTLSPLACGQVTRLIEHRAWAPRPDPAPKVRRTFRELDPLAVRTGLMILLHEGGHVAQWRAGYISDERPCESVLGCELDAECRALAALPRALKTLGYGFGVRQRAAASMRYEIRFVNPAPYSGRCPAAAWSLR